jgi:hypothetical protein
MESMHKSIETYIKDLPPYYTEQYHYLKVSFENLRHFKMRKYLIPRSI